MAIDFSKYGKVLPAPTGNIDFSKYGTPVSDPQTEAPKISIADKIAHVGDSLFGGGQIGAGIGTIAARAQTRQGDGIQTADYDKLSPESKAKLEKMGVPTSRQAQLDESAQAIKGPSAEQLIGDVGRIALNFVPVGEGIALAKDAKKLSTIARIAEASKIGGKFGAGIGAADTLKQNGTAGDVALGALEGAATGAATGGVLGLAGEGLSRLPKILPKAENLMQKVSRTTPIKQANFEKIAGESQGSYLAKRGIFGDEKSVMNQLYDRFTASKNEADTALGQLEGNFKSKPLDTALEDLVSRENRVSSPGAKSPDLDRAKFLKNKHDTVGLNMKEVNEAKRLYERNIKLDFLKTQNVEGVARANNIDNALRGWQFEQAQKLGLKNLPEINKETRLAKQLLDDMGRAHSGKASNNAISLTDWILLSNGDPKSIAVYTAKKILTNNKLQGSFAKLISKKPSIGAIKAEFGGKTGLPALIPGRDYGTTIEMGAPKSPTTFEAPSRKINRSMSLKDQLLLTEGKKGTRAGPTLKLPSKFSNKTDYIGK